jgi:glycolate oxidase iron-sulfur subunit
VTQDLRSGLDACVHCGFCLSACPTYLALDDENDSPRGRLVLMRALLDGRVDAGDADLSRHLDQCLGCRGCETACPSGVPYGHLLEATRAQLRERQPLPWLARIVLAVFARGWLLTPALFVARVVRGSGLAAIAARVLPRGLAFPAAMLASTSRPGATSWIPTSRMDRASASNVRDDSTLRTAVLTGCVMEGLLPSVNRATERVLAHNGHQLVTAPEQVCCGALHAHAGDLRTARTLARRNIAAFEQSGAEQIAMNSAGCGAMCRDYGALLADDPAWAERAAAFSAKVRDVSELLAAAGPKPTRATTRRTRVAWDAPCHLEHAQRVKLPPMQVLAAIGNITAQPLPDSDQCCGSAGIFTLIQPELSARVLAPKLARIRESGAEVVATANPGCLMQIGGGLLQGGQGAVARHPVELLDAAYAAEARTD